MFLIPGLGIREISDITHSLRPYKKETIAEIYLEAECNHIKIIRRLTE